MATVIVMPQLSPTMEEGRLLKWTKKQGDKVGPGDSIAEVETDKANMDFTLEDEGTLLRLLVKEGDTVKMGAPVAVLGEPGEDVDALLAGGAAPAKAAPAPAATTSAPAATANAPAATTNAPAATTSAPAATTNAPAATTNAPAATTDGPAATTSANGGTSLRASPLARKVALERGLDLRGRTGSGPHGRIVLRDLDQMQAQAAAPATSAPAPRVAKQARPATRGDETIPLSPMRKTIARRLTEAKATVPHFYVTMDARCDALWELHRQIKEATQPATTKGAAGDGPATVKVGLNDLILKAVATALWNVPEANASYTEQGIVRHGRVDLGIAVSIDDGLVTPVLRDADEKSVSGIAAEARDLIERARARKLRGDEFTGATFSVSNMGMYGVKAFSAVISPPEGGILAVGAMEKRVEVVTLDDGSDDFRATRMMTLTLSADHRVVDGALAARLLGEIVRIIEHPLLMVI